MALYNNMGKDYAYLIRIWLSLSLRSGSIFTGICLYDFSWSEVWWLFYG